MHVIQKLSLQIQIIESRAFIRILLHSYIVYPTKYSFAFLKNKRAIQKKLFWPQSYVHGRRVFQGFSTLYPIYIFARAERSRNQVLVLSVIYIGQLEIKLSSNLYGNTTITIVTVLMGFI